MNKRHIDRYELRELIANAVTTTSWGDGKKIKFSDEFYDFLLGLYYDEKQELLSFLKRLLTEENA